MLKTTLSLQITKTTSDLLIHKPVFPRHNILKRINIRVSTTKEITKEDMTTDIHQSDSEEEDWLL
jgi:hypothetical protein